MARSGWKLVRSILKVSLADDSIKLDRDGLQCELLDAEGIPVSVTGKKQAAKLLQGISPNAVPMGETKSYTQLYDIIGTYTINVQGVPESTPILVDGVPVAEFKGGAMESCPIEYDVIFSASPNPTPLVPLGAENTPTLVSVLSKVDGVPRAWSVQTEPAWLVAVNSSGTLAVSYPMNPTSGIRSGIIKLKQGGTGALLDVNVNQPSPTGTFYSTPSSGTLKPLGTSIDATPSTFTISSSIDGVSTGWSLQSKSPWLTSTISGNILSLDYALNNTGTVRSGSVILKQNTTNELLTISLSQSMPTGNFSSSPSLGVLKPLGTTLDGPASTFTITSEVGGTAAAWTVESVPAWSSHTKSGNVISLTYGKNETGSARPGSIILKQSLSGASLIISVSQATPVSAFSSSPGSGTLKSLGTTYGGGPSVFAIASTVDGLTVGWSIQSKPGFVTATTPGGTVSLTYAINETGSVQTGDLVLKQDLTDATLTIPLSQAVPSGILTSSPSSGTLKPLGSTFSGPASTFTITSTVDATSVPWTVQSHSPWVSLSVSGAVITATYLRNDTAGTQTGTIVLKQQWTDITLTINLSQLKPEVGFGSTPNPLILKPLGSLYNPGTPTTVTIVSVIDGTLTGWTVEEIPPFVNIAVSGNTITLTYDRNFSPNSKVGDLVLKQTYSDSILEIGISQESPVILLSSSPSSAGLNPEGSTFAGTTYNLAITSSIDGVPATWTVQSKPAWITTSGTAPLALTYGKNETGVARDGTIVLKQAWSDRTLSIPVSQARPGTGVHFSTSPSSLTLKPLGSAYEPQNPGSMTIVSDIDDTPKGWVITSRPPWLTTNVNGNLISFVYSVAPGIARAGTLVLTQNISGEILNISVSQAAPAVVLTSTPNSWALNPLGSVYPGGVKTTTVVSTADGVSVGWSVQSKPAFLNTSISGNTLTLSPLVNDRTLKSGNVVLVQNYTGATINVAVTQAVLVTTFTANPSSLILQLLGSTGDSVTITSTGNGQDLGWSVQSKPDWLTASIATPEVDFSYSKNETGSTRSGLVVLKQNISGDLLTISVSQVPIYGNIRFSRWVQRAVVSVPDGNIGHWGEYVVPAKTFWATSQQDANDLAIDNMDSSAQSWANGTLGHGPLMTLAWCLEYRRVLPNMYSSPLGLILEGSSFPRTVLDEISIDSSRVNYTKSGIFNIANNTEFTIKVKGDFGSGVVENFWVNFSETRFEGLYTFPLPKTVVVTAPGNVLSLTSYGSSPDQF